MKQVAITCVALVLSCLCFSQENTDKGYVALSLGAAIPVGDFANTSLDNEKAGFARTAIPFELSACYKLGKNFGIEALFRTQSHNINEDPLMNAFRGLGYYGTSVLIETKPWRLHSYLIGANAFGPLGNGSTSFEARFLFGYVNATSPENKTTVNQNSYIATAKVYSATAGNIGFLIGGGFRFNASKNIAFLLGADLETSSIEFSDVRTESTYGNYIQTSMIQPFTIVNFSFGLAYRFAAK